MTSAYSHMPEYFRPSSTLSMDSRSHNLFDDDEDSSILDENILEPNSLEAALDMSPMQRRDSYVDSTPMFSPKVEWDFDRDMTVPDRLMSASTNPFEQHDQQSNNPFMRLEPAQVASYGHQSTTAWAMEDDYSGSCTPTAVYDSGYNVEFESNIASSYLSGSTPGPSTYDNHSASHIRPVSVFPSAPSTNASVPPSPHPTKDWMPSNASTEQLEPRSIPKRMRPNSPSPRSNSPLLRRDGIRKKNARFEIPAERNLLNIDHLIAQSADDQEIKELKQQKRLLRNRQAALDSRQRKKQHTERLEEEKKQYTTIISELEERLAQLEVRESEHLRQEEEWKAMQQRYDQYIQSLELEKEEMVRSHTLETGELRKKNAYLTEHIQSAAMSAVPSSSGFSTEFSDMDNMTVDNFWGNSPSFLEDISMETPVRPDNSLIKKPTVSDEDKPATSSGLLLILLLCGAFVASKSSTTSTPAIPRMPEEIRAASAAVLDNIFKDAGVQQQTDPRLSVNRVESLDMSPSSTAWPAPKTTLSAAQMVGLSGSSLDVLNHQLVQPTKEQEQEQLFSLSVDQYNGVTSHDFGREPEPSTSRGRRNLEESLAAMRNNNKGSAAEVYTRSLLWDRVPADVVRQFAKLVAESNSRNGEHQNGDAMG